MTQTTISYITNDGGIIVENPSVSHFFLIDENNEYVIDVIDYGTYDGQGILYSFGNEYPLPLNIYSCDGNLLTQDLISEYSEYDTFSEYIEENPNIFTFIGTLSNDNKILYVGEVGNTSSVLLNFENKTVSSLYIHNKEVQSIITSNNVILYEKENSVTPVVSEPYSISLSASKYILSEHDTDTCVLTAIVTDENNDACSNQSVVFTSDTTVLGTTTTDSNGVATLNYNSQGNGDIFITANINDLYSNSILIEDCQYYNDGSTVTGLDVKSGVSCSSDGEWITITTSTSGEKFVYPPVCYTGSDNWEVSFKCKTSSYTNQAFGLQMENCGTTTYSGDSQYTSYSGSSFGNCMGAGNKTYSNLSDNDKLTFKRIDGYWRLYVNDATEVFNRQYTWSNSRVPGFYTNKSRIQRLKELKYKLIRSYNLTINVPTSILLNTEQTFTGVLTDNSNNPCINQNVNLVIDNVIVDTQRTNNNGLVTFNYTPSSVGSISVKLTHTGNYNCESLTHTLTIGSDKLSLNANKNIISHKHNETCNLTAIYNDGSGATINLYNDDTDTLLGVMTDNNDGTYSYTYNATGYGDLTFRAECDNESVTTSISDYLLYDDASIDKSNSYGIYVSNSGGYATFTYDNTNKWYDFTVDTLKDKLKIMQFGEFTDNDLLYELDILIVNKTTPFNCMSNLRDVNDVADGNSNGLQLGTWSNQRFVRFMKNNTNMNTDSPSGALGTGVNYRLIASIDNTNSTLTATIFNKDTDSVLLTKTWNDTVSTNDKWYAIFGQYGYGSATTTRIKRIMVKKL